MIEELRKLYIALDAGDDRAAAAALSLLNALAKKRAEREQIIDGGGIDAAKRALLLPEPKARKNAARLLGEIGTEADALIDALKRESTRFVVPSILLSLGAIGGDAARKALQEFIPPQAASVEEEKHCREIAQAHKKALGRVMPKKHIILSKLNAVTPVMLIHPEGLADVLLDELSELGFDGTQTENGILVETDDLTKLYRARSFFEALLPCGTVENDPTAIAFAARRGYSLFCDAENGAPSLPYRIELRGTVENRGETIRRIANAVGGMDNPSDYRFELRVNVRENLAEVSVKPTAVKDVRFAYRKASLPASIHPVTAAALARMAIGSLTAGKHTVRVYDVCCGSGTLLIECEKAILSLCSKGTNAVLFGTDIAEYAVRIAKGNLEAAHCRGTILQKDLRKFVPREPFDLVVGNLPFGNRVGDHKNNEALYRELIQKLPDWMADDGLALLYTMEGRLLEACIKKNPRILLIDTVRTDAGGLTPRAYLLTKQ